MAIFSLNIREPVSGSGNYKVSLLKRKWSKFPFLADKVEKAADSNRDCGKYDINIISRISNLHKHNRFPF